MEPEAPTVPLSSVQDEIASLGVRIVEARTALATRSRKKVSQERLGKLVARELGKSQAFAGPTVSRWEVGTTTPDLFTLWAIAKVCDVDPGWLAFGAETEAPSPQRALTGASDPSGAARRKQFEVWSEYIRAILRDPGLPSRSDSRVDLTMRGTFRHYTVIRFLESTFLAGGQNFYKAFIDALKRVPNVPPSAPQSSLLSD